MSENREEGLFPRWPTWMVTVPVQKLPYAKPELRDVPLLKMNANGDIVFPDGTPFNVGGDKEAVDTVRATMLVGIHAAEVERDTAAVLTFAAGEHPHAMPLARWLRSAYEEKLRRVDELLAAERENHELRAMVAKLSAQRDTEPTLLAEVQTED
jgi:hypothetical protein